MTKHYQVLIVGGGTGGIMTAAQLLKARPQLQIGIIEPSETHYYQPAWTLVGAGAYSFNKTAKPMASVMPKGVHWIKDWVTALQPQSKRLETRNEGLLSYDFLVLSPGLVMEPSLLEGLPEALERGLAVSNYLNPEKVWQKLQDFKGGNAVFTQPTTPIKCGGAPQKIAYLAADYLRKQKLSDRSKVVFATPGSVIFGVKPIRSTLMQVIENYGIHFRPFYAPVKIDSDQREIHFHQTHPDENQCVINEDDHLGERVQGDMTTVMPFDFLHLAPPQAAPPFIRNSALANAQGWLAVNQHSLQHQGFPEIFGLGDVAALPTAKTGAAIRKQVPVVVDNLLSLIDQKEAQNFSYQGYSSCPLVTSYDKMVLAEFDYEGNFTPDPKLKRLLIKDSAQEHRRLYLLKKYGLPYLYWNKMLKGAQV